LPTMDINDGLSIGMKIIGDKFEAVEIYLPQIILSYRAILQFVDELKPVGTIMKYFDNSHLRNMTEVDLCGTQSSF